MDISNHRTRLGNGIDVLLTSNPAARTLTLSLLGRRGALDDPPGKAGLAHLVEHLWAAGEGGDGPASQTIEEVGGRLEGATYPSYVRFEVQVPEPRADVARRTLAELFKRGPALDSFENERQAVLAECHEAREDVSQRVNALTWDALGREPLYKGFRPDLFRGIEALEPDDVRRWPGLLGTDQWVLCAQSPAGPVGGGRDLLETLEEVFNLPTAPGTPRTPSPFRPERRTLVRIERVPEGSHLALGVLFAGAGLEPGDYAAAQVASNLLTGGNLGRLCRELRHERGLVYDVTSFATVDSEIGGMEFYTFVEEGKGEEAIGVFRDTLAAVAAGRFSPAELIRATALASGSFLVEMESPARLARWVSNRYLALGWTLTPAEWYDLLLAVTAEDLARMARSLFERSQAVWAVSGPVSPALERALRNLGEVEEV